MNKIKKYFFYPKLLRLGKALPFSFGGLILIAASTWALTSIGIKKQDLVVTILCCCLIAIITLLAILCVFFANKTKQKIALTIGLDENTTFSQIKNQLSILIENSSIPAFFNLKVTCIFSPDSNNTSELIISGKSSEIRHAVISARFPHRGFWQLIAFKIEFADALGLSRQSWRIPQKKTIRVMPVPVEIQPISIVASSSKPGEEINLPRERSGDLFDIKQYEKSDGVKRILWKTYARSRQLFVRKPELAIIPEGEVAVYLIANKENDNVAAACMAQIKSLIENDLIVVFGSDLTHTETARSFEKIEDLMLKAAFDNLAGSGKCLASFVSDLKEKNHDIRQINVFAPDDEKYIETLTKQVAPLAIKINLIIVQNSKSNLRLDKLNISDFEVNVVTPRQYANI